MLNVLKVGLLFVAAITSFHCCHYQDLTGTHNTSKKLTSKEKYAICVWRYNVPHGIGSFEYLRGNVNRKNVSFNCVHNCGFKCKCKIFIKRCGSVVDYGAISYQGTHTRTCFIRNNPNRNPEDYPYAGKPTPAEVDADDENIDSNVGPNKLCIVEKDTRSKTPDVSEDTRQLCDNLSTTTLTKRPISIWG